MCRVAAVRAAARCTTGQVWASAAVVHRTLYNLASDRTKG